MSSSLSTEPVRGSGADAASGAWRLLVVDDEESVALTIGEVLRQEGYEVDTAASGEEAEGRLANELYNLVLTDLHMERGDGLSVLEAVRKHSPFTISIVLTGFASIESAIAALRKGAYDYLVKPCIIDELKFTVRRGLEHQQLMVAEQRARTSLEELNRDLERRVEERTAELQRLNRELSEANRTKDIFLATLSHELRTPLTPVLGWVNLLRSGGNRSDATLLSQGLEAIERNARLQARLIDDLLDISRIVSGKLQIEREPVDLATMASAAVETVRGDAEARQIRIELELPPSPLVVTASPVRLQQIAWNLLSNAIKFTPDGGVVRVRVESQGNEALLVVEDTGIGIEPDFLPHVFDLFRQADGSTTRLHGGLGLGLAIVRALAEIHGGRVVAESEGVGRGARFTFRMPPASVISGEAAGDDAPHEQASLQRMVLVVDDSPETLEILDMLLTRRGCAVMTAETATAALELIERHPPAIIISDLSMNEMDGYEFLARLRCLKGMSEIPVVALSGYAMEEDRQRALAAGFSLHLAKPVDPDHLIAVIQELTQKQ